MSNTVSSPGVSRTRVVCATGGTGGHIYPALALADALTAQGHEVSFVGHHGGMEAVIVPSSGYPFYGVRAGKWARGNPDPSEAWRALMGLFDARTILKKVNPAVVVGFGGFASFPGVAAASWLGLPLLLHESNAFPGRVTRWFAGRATLIAVTEDTLKPRLANAKRFEKVGWPVREVHVDKQQARRQLGLPETGLVTLVMGGSQGSAVLNRHVPEAYRALPDELRESLMVLHSSGERHVGQVEDDTATLANYVVRAYLDAPLAWSAADLAITRAGIGTLSEAAYHGVPLIMVPLPSSAEDHQQHNARAVAAAGAGWLVPQAELGKLAETWRSSLLDTPRRHAAAAAKARSPEGAAARFARLVDELVYPPRHPTPAHHGDHNSDSHSGSNKGNHKDNGAPRQERS